ncbi:MAG: hypothetical protein U0736_08305 [Gemmataceae bacterium]
MAKKPDDPRRPLPGDPDDRNPKAKKPPEPTDSDSAINLGEPAPEGDLSGISVIEWASLVEEPAGGTGASSVKIDSPSDAELIAQLSDIAPLPTADAPGGFVADETPSAVDLAGAGRPPAADEDDVIVAELVDSSVHLAEPVAETAAVEEFVDLGAEMEAAEPAPAAAVTGDEVEMLAGEEVIDLEAAVADERHVGATAGDADVIDLLQPELAGEASAVELGEDAVEHALDLGSAESSGVDLGNAAAVPSAPVEPGVESSIDLLAENLLFEESGPGSKAGGSSRDLLAEELESGLDLARPTDASEEISDDDFFAQVGGDGSSSVDLGSAHTIDVFTEEEARQAAEQGARKRADRAKTPASDINLDDFVQAEGEAAAAEAEVSEEEIDLDKIGAFDEAQGGSPAEWGNMPTDEDAAFGAKPARKATAAAVADEVAVAEDEDEAPKKKGKKGKAADEAPAKRRGSAGAWVGGTFLGTLIGAGACVAVWFAGLVPDSGSPKPAPTGTGAAVQPPQPAGPPPAEVVAREVAKIRTGQFDEVKPEEFDKAPEVKPEDLVARAEFLWLNYLRSERGRNPQAPLRLDAEPVKKAMADLDKGIAAKLPDARYLRGQIFEMTGDEAKARADYQEGAKEFAAIPAERARFESALQVLDLSRKVSHLTPPGMSPTLVALLFIHLQQPPVGNPVPPPAGAPVPPPAGAPTPTPLPPEAAPAFWQAIGASRKPDYAAAIKALDEARALHNQRRFLLPRQQQNPKTDSQEKVFLQCCDELRSFWTMQGRLNDYLAGDPKERIEVVDKLLARADAGARADLLKKLAADLVKDKPVDNPADLVKLIDAERKTAADKLAAADEAITGQKKQIAGLAEKLKMTADTLTTTADVLTKTVAAEKAARALGQDAVATLKEVGGVVGSDFADLKTSKETLLDDVRAVARMAKVVDPMGKIRQLERDLADDRAKTPASDINLDDFVQAEGEAAAAEAEVSEEEIDLDKIGAFDEAQGGSPTC